MAHKNVALLPECDWGKWDCQLCEWNEGILVGVRCLVGGQPVTALEEDVATMLQGLRSCLHTADTSHCYFGILV